MTVQTVGKWRRRFVEQRLYGLLDAPRPGEPRKITDAKVEQVIATTLERRPRQATHWSTRLMAKATGLNETAIFRIWQAFGLQPHRAETFKLSTDPLFIDKARDIVGLYCGRLPVRWFCASMRSRKFRPGLNGAHAAAVFRHCRAAQS